MTGRQSQAIQLQDSKNAQHIDAVKLNTKV